MKTRFLLLSMTLLLTQTSCIFDNDIPCGSEDSDLLVINLNLTVPSSSTGTRSEDHKLDAGSKDENYINITGGDYQVLLFDKDGDLVENKLSDFECKENGVNGGMTSYTLTTKLSLSGNEDKVRLSKFKVMVLANWKSFENSNTETSFDYPSFTDYKLTGDEKNIYRERSNLNFTLKSPGANESAWVPSATANKGIPMFGVTDELDLQYVIDMSKYGDGPSFNIPLLRGMAKIEIVDMVPDEKGANISECVLTAYNTTGRFIPDVEANVLWHDDYTQVTAPSLPTSPVTASNLLFARYKADESIEGTTYSDKDHFVVYIPEMDFEDVTEDEYPTIEVKINNMTYTIFLGNYNSAGKIEEINGKKQLYEYILRNHSYRFDITSVGSTELDFVVETPWRPVDEDEWYYEDLKIGFELGKEFKWTNISEDNYPSFEDDTGFEEDGLLNPERTIIISQDNWVEGAFTLNSPAKGTWTIALYGDDNTPNDQFRIDIKKDNDWEEGNDTYTGKVGEEVIFRIIPVAANNNTEHSRARVVLTCTSFDNQMLEVNLPYYHFDSTGTEMPKPSVDNNDYFYVKQYYSGFGANDE